jgi:DNA repair exonuclease SbcCD ATPase subunit
MNISKISIHNILGISDLEITPGAITEVSGSNGSGKTSVIEAVKAALGGGHDATLLRNGAEKGQVVLVLDDGTEIERRVTAAKSDTIVRHPEMGKLSKPVALLKNLTDALSVNPLDFLTASPKERVDVLLKSVPAEVTADQLKTVPVDILSGIDISGHALPVLDEIRSRAFSVRAGWNRSAKDKRATVAQLESTLPDTEATPEDVAALESELEMLRTSTAAAVKVVRREAQEADDAAKADLATVKDGAAAHRDAMLAESREAYDRAVVELQERRRKEEAHTLADYTSAVESATANQTASKEARDAKVAKALARLQAEYEPKQEALARQIGAARQARDLAVKAAETRKFVGLQRGEAEAAEKTSARLTAAIEHIDGLKKGERVKRLCVIEVLKVEREPLSDIGRGADETAREGLRHMTPAEFVAFFCAANKCESDTEVTRIEFRKLPGAMRAKATAQWRRDA